MLASVSMTSCMWTAMLLRMAVWVGVWKLRRMVGRVTQHVKRGQCPLLMSIPTLPYRASGSARSTRYTEIQKPESLQLYPKSVIYLLNAQFRILVNHLAGNWIHSERKHSWFYSFFCTSSFQLPVPVEAKSINIKWILWRILTGIWSSQEKFPTF